MAAVPETGVPGYVLINGETGQLGTSTHMSGNPTYQEQLSGEGYCGSHGRRVVAEPHTVRVFLPPRGSFFL